MLVILVKSLKRVMKFAKPANSQPPSKILPHNLEAEQAILGGILIINDAMNQIMDIISAEDFYREANAHLLEGMIGLCQWIRRHLMVLHDLWV